MTDGLAIAKVVAEYEHVVPVFFGEESFGEVFAYCKEKNILCFNDLENVANIL